MFFVLAVKINRFHIQAYRNRAYLEQYSEVCRNFENQQVGYFVVTVKFLKNLCVRLLTVTESAYFPALLLCPTHTHLSSDLLYL